MRSLWLVLSLIVFVLGRVCSRLPLVMCLFDMVVVFRCLRLVVRIMRVFIGRRVVLRALRVLVLTVILGRFLVRLGRRVQLARASTHLDACVCESRAGVAVQGGERKGAKFHGAAVRKAGSR